MRRQPRTVRRVLDVLLASATGVELLLHVPGVAPVLILVPVASLSTYWVLRVRDRRPVLAMSVFCGLFAAEAFLLHAAEQITALVVWALVAYTVGTARSGRAIAGLLPCLLPLVVFKAANPVRDWLDFAPSTSLLVLTAWAGGWVMGGRTAPELSPGDRASGDVPVMGPPSSLPVEGAPRAGDVTGLSAREQEVLDLLATGMTNPEIAAALHVSRATVKTHVSHILAKLGVEDRVQAAVLAARAGRPSGVGRPAAGGTSVPGEAPVPPFGRG